MLPAWPKVTSPGLTLSSGAQRLSVLSLTVISLSHGESVLQGTGEG